MFLLQAGVVMCSIPRNNGQCFYVRRQNRIDAPVAADVAGCLDRLEYAAFGEVNGRTRESRRPER
jgi:hypothetical protein